MFSKQQEVLNVISLVASRDPLPQPCVCEAALHVVTHGERPHPTPVSVTSGPWPPGPLPGRLGGDGLPQSSCWLGIYRLQVNGGQVWQQGCVWRFISQGLRGTPCASCPGRLQCSTHIHYFGLARSRARGPAGHVLPPFGGNEGRPGAPAAGDVPPGGSHGPCHVPGIR